MRALTERVEAGARDDLIEGVEVVLRPALAADADDVLAADAIVLGTPANFGYMSGALKHFFDSTFLRIGGALADDGSAGGSSGDAPGGSVAADSGGGRQQMPFGLYVHGRYDTTGAVRSVQAITAALPWRQGFDVLEVLGDLTGEHREAAYELGGTLAALVSA
ncbi:hypothetical protein KILIM_021_00200 [Kineosphaera limosa NBRC 100340]|uniref:NADPH-dependent FMN reductase-like domain-containing protein n=2 Tax=Kineosphaera TaxID=211469 RepID=K6W8F5_9MICO|nr:hypothetical protein KILIM_021_00200 [Kineosphaera limosa NBRC 100340]